ncbi:DUF4259 domain-containing protein [Deinococcus antarcticus]|uniref:DUF4259 domain-containing protein n=1 Tax=Deinococcus antarcticus TaxID=1298767 RepID=A0ABV8A7T3_9DEIO
MNMWNYGSFDNESAKDFIAEVVQDGHFALREAFEVVLDPDMDFVEAEEGVRAVAAAEILVAVLNGDTARITDAGLRGWVQNADKTTLADLRQLASEALDRILAPESVLPELWEDTEEYSAWLSDVGRLCSGLG